MDYPKRRRSVRLCASVAILFTLGVAMFSGEQTGEAKTVKTVEKVIEKVVYRDRPVGESMALIQRDVKENNARALKIKVGGLMFETAELEPRWQLADVEKAVDARLELDEGAELGLAHHRAHELAARRVPVLDARPRIRSQSLHAQ